MRISIFGLGYVGCVSAACLSKRGHSIVGVDVAAEKVDLIAQGRPTVVEPKVEPLLAEAHQAGLLTATTDVQDAVRDSDVSLICVGTPSAANGALDMQYVAKVSQQIGAALKEKPQRHLVIVRSTLRPGTMESVVLPALRDGGASSGDLLDDLLIVPEFLREGTAVDDYFQSPMTVVGHHPDCSGGRANGHQTTVADLFAVEAASLQWVRYKEAEVLKTLCNAFHALKVVFGNEVGALCSILEIDGGQVMELLCQDRKLNISPAYLRPGLPYGGSCLPKDLRNLVCLGHQMGVDLPVLGAVGPSNEAHKRRMCMRALQRQSRYVGLDGLAFKSGTDDLRESPLVELAEFLIGKGYELKILDPAVDAAKLRGANREYIDQRIPHLAGRLVATPEQLLDHADVLILTRSNAPLLKAARGCGKKIHVIDLSANGPTLREFTIEPPEKRNSRPAGSSHDLAQSSV